MSTKPTAGIRLYRASMPITGTRKLADSRTFAGMATTPTPDRMGDIVEPLGVRFKNPLPLLWQHRIGEPVGRAIFSRPTEAGIAFTASIETTATPGPLKDRLEEAWESVRLGLVSSVSIGFRSLERKPLPNGGIHFLKSEVFELSLVTIPANPEAAISAMKAALKAATPAAPRLYRRGTKFARRGLLYEALDDTRDPPDVLSRSWVVLARCR